MRTEHDSLGDVLVPDEARYGAQTQRAVENFPISGRRMPPPLIHALGRIKAAAAVANERSDDVPLVDAETGPAIAAAATEVAEGRWDDQFPVDVYQTGSGTSTNMNANEVIASRATELCGRPVHPNDHVNASQSSNDVIPTAVRVSVAVELSSRLAPAVDGLAAALERKAAEVDGIVTTGRTHLMDAAPLFVGDELGAWAAQLRAAHATLFAAVPSLCELPIGGSAVGTGLNVPAGWVEVVLAELRRETGLELTPSPDRFAAMAGGEAYLAVSAGLRGLAVALTKVFNDVRLLASGPSCGLAELRLPALQPGSSIMPGKVNPVLPEAALQVAARVVGNDATVTVAASGGVLQLNTFQPLVADVLHESIALLAAVMEQLDRRCVAGLEVDADRCRAYAERSPSLVTGAAATIGYERSAHAVQRSLREGRTIREVLRDEGIADEELDRVLDPAALARGGVHRL